MYRETILKGPGQWTRLNIRCKLPNLFVFALKSFLMCLGFYHLITIGSIVTNSWMFNYRRSPIISSGPRSDLGHWTSSEDNVIRTQVQRDSNNVTNGNNKSFQYSFHFQIQVMGTDMENYPSSSPSPSFLIRQHLHTWVRPIN